MTSPSTFVFSGGGTGGHLFPGIAVARELRRRDPQVRLIFVGSERAIESTIVVEHELEHRILPVEPLPVLKRNPIRFLWRNMSALRAARRLLDETQPLAVIGLGGYASAPLVWAAGRKRIPVVLLEQNVIPGRTTRWLSRLATCVCVSFAECVARLPQSQVSKAGQSRPTICVTGNPVRPEIAALASTSNLSREANNPRELLVLGGSQGADSLNEAVVAAVKAMQMELAEWKIIHQSGPRQIEFVKQAYADADIPAEVDSFFHDMSQRYARASLVVSRAGATTLAELTCAGLPMILLPYPRAADDHQNANAKLFATSGAAVTVEHANDPAVTASELANALKELLHDAGRRSSMSVAATMLAQPNAAAAIADHVLAACQTPHS